MEWTDQAILTGLVLLVIFLLYAIIRMARNYFKGGDDLW